MSEEIELKLALPPEAQRAFLRHPLLKTAAHKQTYRLTNIYYDTPTLALRKRGIALRLRAQGKFWLQSIKCAGQRAGGLSARPEWETPYGGHFDFGVIDDAAVRAWLSQKKIAGRLQPVFETNFQRTAWVFERVRGTRIELAFDRGFILAGEQQELISEIEIELKVGETSELFALALELAARLPLVPAPLSKADRGYGLYQRLPAAPSRATTVPISANDTPQQAFRAIALGCLDHLERNHAGAIHSDDPEYIHQMRVALRRLRAALRLFAPLLPPDFTTRLLPKLRELMAMLGSARDYDVLQSEIIAPVAAALPDEPRLAALARRLAEESQAARAAAIAHLRAPHHGELVIGALAMLHALALPPSDAAAPTLSEFAQARLRRLRKKVRALAAAARSDDAASLHALRIGIKRLRYALEFFSPLLASKPLRKALAHLAALQDTLGQINDLANAGTLLSSCAGDDAELREAVALIGGWHAPRYRALLEAVPKGLDALNQLKLPRLAPARIV